MKYCFVVSALFIVTGAFAQAENASNPYGWKKIVSREIELVSDETKIKDKRPEGKGDVMLSKMMADAVGSGKVTGYSNFDMTLSTPLKDYEMSYTIIGTVDTVDLTDPVTGKTFRKIIRRDINYAYINKYRILEEWTFDPIGCSTRVQILGIAPIKDIYGDDGVFRGKQAMFWLHYADVKALIDKYDMSHARRKAGAAIWYDNFARGADGTKNKKQLLATRVLDVPLENEEQPKRHYRDYRHGSSVALVLTGEKYEGKAVSWGDFNKQLITQLDKLQLADPSLEKTDTNIIVDPISDKEFTTIIRERGEPKWHKLKLVEEWKFDELKGQTDISIVAIAPLGEKVVRDTAQFVPAFWLRYSDVRMAIAQNDVYMPSNSFALNLWNNYFLSDAKPELMK